MGRKEEQTVSSRKAKDVVSTSPTIKSDNDRTEKFDATVFFLRMQEKMLKSHIGILHTTFVQRLDDKCRGKYIPPPTTASDEPHSTSDSDIESIGHRVADKNANDRSTSDKQRGQNWNSSTQSEPSELLKMMMQREEAERSDLFQNPSMNYGCLAELSACYRMDTLLKMCTDLTSIANALHRSLISKKEKIKMNEAKLNTLLDEAIKVFRVTNAIAEIFSITPLAKSKLPDDGAKFHKFLDREDEMDFYTPTNDGLQIVANPEQYILKFEGQIDHMRYVPSNFLSMSVHNFSTAVNEIGKCLSTITRVLKSIVPGMQLIDEVSEHKIDALIYKMPPSCGEAKRITLSPSSSNLLSNPPRDKPCMQHFTADDDPCLLVEKLYEKLCSGEKVWDFEKGPFISESDDEFDVPSTTSKSTRNGKTSESTQPSSTHLGRRHRKQSKTSNT
uniref:Mediator complex subunit 1 n=1 Tax=Ascaris lumbricoides TaxID=6252 RepID=A0A0M3I1K7_ASCLU